MNKRYDQFTAGTYDAAKIFLVEDTGTQQLEKITLGDIPSGGSTNLSIAPDTNNSGSNPQTIATITIPANTLLGAGSTIRLKAVINYLTAVGSKTFTIAIAGNTLSSRTNTASGIIIVDSVMTMPDSTHLCFTSILSNNFSLSTITGPVKISFNPTISNDITLIISAGAANDIYTQQIYVSIQP
jgi:hypothetical protein